MLDKIRLDEMRWRESNFIALIASEINREREREREREIRKQRKKR